MQTTLPQPPPDLSPPPPGRAAKRSWYLAGGMVLLLLVIIGYGLIKIRERRFEVERNAIFNNLRSLGYAMLEFDAEYASFPNEETLADVCEATGNEPWPLQTSNDMLRQVIAIGLKSEKPFSDNGRARWTRKPDDVTSPLSKALEPGEFAFAYIPGHSSASHPRRPILLYPMLPGGRTFDRKPLGGRALLLHTDGSVTSAEIDRNGRAIVSGKDLFDPSQPFWRGTVPKVYEPAR